MRSRKGDVAVGAGSEERGLGVEPGEQHPVGRVSYAWQRVRGETHPLDRNDAAGSSGYCARMPDDAEYVHTLAAGFVLQLSEQRRWGPSSPNEVALGVLVTAVELGFAATPTVVQEALLLGAELRSVSQRTPEEEQAIARMTPVLNALMGVEADRPFVPDSLLAERCDECLQRLLSVLREHWPQ